MNASRGRFALVFVALMAATAGWAADPPPAVPSDNPTGVSSNLDLLAAATPQQKLDYASDSVSEINDAVEAMGKLLAEAEKANDATAVNCIKSRLTSVTALQSVVVTAEEQLKTALAANEDEMADHQFRKIAVGRSKTRILLAEAQRCASDNKLESGTTLVDWNTVLTDEDEFLEVDLSDFDIGPVPPSISEFVPSGADARSLPPHKN